MNYSILKPYVTKTSNLKFDSNNDKLYNLIFLGENINFFEAYQHLNIPVLYVKDLHYLKYRDQNIKVLNTEKKVKDDAKELNLKFGSVNPETIKKRKRNFFTEITDIFNKIIDVYPNIRSSKTYLKVNNLLELINSNYSDTHKNVLIYTVDLDKKFKSDFKKRKIFVILRMLYLHIKQPDNFKMLFDDMLLCIIKDSYPVYILLIKNKKFKIEKIVNLFKKLKFIEKDEYEEDEKDFSNLGLDLDEENKKLIDKFDLQKKDIKKIKQLENNQNSKDDKQNYKNKEKNDKNEKQDNKKDNSLNKKIEDKKLIIKTIVGKITNNDEAVEKVSNKIKNINNNEVLDIILKQTKDDLFDKYNLKSLEYKNNKVTNNPILNNVDIFKVVDKKVPKKVLSKRKEDFNNRLNDHIKETFKILEKKDYPLKLKSFDVIDDSSTDSEIKKSTFSLVKVTLLEEDTKKEFNIDFKIPKIIDDNYFYLNGIKKVIVNQLIQIPILFLKPYICRVQTNFATITIKQKVFKSLPIFEIYVGGFHIPLILVCFYYFGFNETLKLFDIKYKIISANKDNEKNNVINNSIFVNDKYFVFENLDKPYKEILINSLKHIKLYKNEENFEFISKEYFSKWIQSLTGNRNSLFIIKEVFDNIIDNISFSILDSKGLPTDIKSIILYIVKKLPSGHFDNSNDLNFLYLRTSDIINHMLFKQLITAYNHYKSQKLISGIGEFVFDGELIFSKLQTSGVIQSAEYINPYEELSYFTRVTFSGFGGINKDAVSIQVRSVNDSYFNNICPVDTPEGGSIGVINHLSVDANIINNNGIFGITKISKDPNSGIFSTSTATVPFSDRNEPTRMIMSAAQSKQIIPVENAQIPAIMTGYEFLLTPYLSENFVKKSMYDGTIVYADEEVIKIKEDKTGIIHNIDISGVKYLKSGLNVNIHSIFKPSISKNKKVKKGDIIAYGTGVKDGIISTGRNLLTAFMNYKGYVFEDGIVVRESVAKSDMFLSKHIFEIEVVLRSNDNLIFINDSIGSQTEKGDVLLRYIPENISDVVSFEDSEESIDVLKNTINVRSVGGKIVDIFIAPNVPLIKFPKLSELYEKQKNKSRIGSYKYKNKPIDGVYIRFTISKNYYLEVGDKMANRHGAKGIVTYIEKDENMPVTPWGQKVDIIVNQIGIINRMNLGQFYELYCSLISYKLGEIILNNGESKMKENLNLILKIYGMLDNTKNKSIYNDFKKYINNINKGQYTELFNRIKRDKYVPLIFPPMMSPTERQVKNVLEYLQLDTGFKLSLPEFNTTTRDKIPVGYCYFNKLEHLAEKKLHSRDVGKYKSKTKQPTAGKANDGGQRIGEGDSYCLLSWDVDDTIKEFFGPLSDDLNSKKEMYNNIIKYGNTNLIKNEKSVTNDLVNYYLKIIGLERYNDEDKNI